MQRKKKPGGLTRLKKPVLTHDILIEGRPVHKYVKGGNAIELDYFNWLQVAVMICERKKLFAEAKVFEKRMEKYLKKQNQSTKY